MATKKVSLISEAITDGNLHLDLPSSKSQALTLHIFLPNERSLVYDLQLIEGQNAGMELLGIIGTILQRKPQEPKDVDKLRDEIRMLKVSLAEKDKTINTYQSKITALEGKLVRASPKKPKTATSPSRRAPAGASKLQPNQKRRQMVEDEFAGSDSEEEEDPRL
ncbi:hypothetical protein M231_00502 [Tremella mesenterica]|uniref:Uncharacterized protein n=1 Tax=Tremella mesenterica TaxID=5217 RepID=A0A4Q1BVJ2_TREME|nr:hypothetical protein M231_00502 [Tremella mesenterica]